MSLSNALIIKQGRVIDPANELDAVKDIYIKNGHIIAIDDHISADKAGDAQQIDASGLIVIPGVIDLCARMREPGLEHKATIKSETIAASKAGITTLCCPPDTDPVIDESAVVDLINQRVKDAAHSHIVCLGALTSGLKGEHLSEMAALKNAGCVGVSNASMPITNTLVLRRALEYASSHDLTVFLQPNDPHLSDHGCAHDGAVATRLGLPGIPSAAESTIIARDLELIAEIGARVHFGRLSSARSIRLIEQAQQQGLQVTADVAVHQLFLTEMDLSSYNSHCHVLPPLRELRDRDTLRQAIADGFIQAICSDHQPHEEDAKLHPFPATEPGISGLETLLPLTLKLVTEGVLSWSQAIASLTSAPARILGIDKGHLSTGAVADLAIIDPDKDWTLETANINSLAKNTPFLGWNFEHQVKHTIISGRLIK
ncbi:MAG: dihydroorotase [Gammaproteobacteria bacterium]|nr:dihydroorotase [Gammaproteobacteria bacterium]